MSKSNVMLGFGKALASVIVGFVGYIFTFISLGVTVGISENAGSGFEGTCIALVLFALALVVVSLVFGIMSIGTFRQNKSSKNGKPIPALVMGIVSVIVSSLDALILLINFLIIFSI